MDIVVSINPGRFTYWIGDWVVSRYGLETVVKRKIPSRDSNLLSSSPLL
jgi:hypothetical protein